MLSDSYKSFLKSSLLSVSAGATVFILWKTWKQYYKKKAVKGSHHRDADSYIKDKLVFIVTTPEEWDSVYPKLIKGICHTKVLGLDCEWVGKNKVALLQLCNPLGVCILIRLSKMNVCPDSLLSLLADKSILKTGVAVTNDGRKLYVDYGCNVAGCVDLRHLLGRVQGVFQCHTKGLKGLSSGILCVDINKDLAIRMGNWEADQYTQAQINYAATDAAVAVDIFLELVKAKMMSINRNSENREIWTVAKSLCQGIVDIGFKQESDSSQGNPRSSKKKPKEGKEAYATRKRPLWDNCRIEAPDGNMLCTCDKRKAQWYLDKELADLMCEDPITIRLRFEPSNRPENERNYYLQVKENICVVCGADKDYVRKFVIPFEYKRFFPSALKDHASHDVLLLCTSCHRKSCDCDSVLRQRLGEECGAPIDSGSSSKTVVDRDLQKVRSAGRALILNKDSIPSNRIQELEQNILDYFGVESLTDEILEMAAEIDAKQTADGFIPHGKKVVRHMISNGGLLAFQTRWRQHFLDTMQPQFLPAYWSVEYVPEGWMKLENKSLEE